MNPIFVHGSSRSGGTLLATIFDAHPHVAMSYEMYEYLLEPLSKIENPVQTAFANLKEPSFKPFKTFVARAKRSGFGSYQVFGMMQKHLEAGLTFDTAKDRLRFIERLAKTKMALEGKTRWGMKIGANFEQIRSVFPDAYIVYILRDGRDIAASRLQIGTFKQTLEFIAESWVSGIEKFQRWRDDKAFLVKYEDLTNFPTREIIRLLAAVDLPWSEDVLRYHAKDLTIYKNPAGHLSRDQVNKPIYSSSIGRWKRELSEDQVEVFHGIAGPTLEKWGYEVPKEEWLKCK